MNKKPVKPIVITRTLVRQYQACFPWTEWMRKRHPRGITVTLDTCRKAVRYSWPMTWVVRYLCEPPAYKVWIEGNLDIDHRYTIGDINRRDADSEKTQLLWDTIRRYWKE